MRLARQEFKTLEPDIIKMYCCGVTPYDACHLGHGRSYVLWDLFRRWFEYRGYRVHYVQNFTDIDDKIIARAQDRGCDPLVLANENIAAYFEDIRALGVRDADAYPRVSECIPEIIALIHDIIDRKFAYVADGTVYYRVRNFPDYGALAGRNVEDLNTRTRMELTPGKESEFDFALWKSAKPGEINWPSPWGNGRPGWHIECSAMLHKHFGDGVDIHGGGEDLRFPHHSNEIAQSECVTGVPLANYWVHHGFVQENGEKMSKSLGNFKTLKDAYKHVNPMVLRLFYLQTHYPKPIEITDQRFEEAQSIFNRFSRLLPFAKLHDQAISSPEPDDEIDEYQQEFEEAMDDDFNTPLAFSCLHDMASRAFTAPETKKAYWAKQVCDNVTNLLGIRLDASYAYVEGDEVVKGLIEKRIKARESRNYEEADAIRQMILDRGIEISDLPGGKTEIIRIHEGSGGA